MYKAMEKVEKLDPMYVRQMIQQFQKDEIQKHKVEQEKAKQIKTSEDDLEIRCKHCNAKATQVSDVRQLGTDYLVLDNSFKGTQFKELLLQIQILLNSFKKCLAYKIYVLYNSNG